MNSKVVNLGSGGMKIETDVLAPFFFLFTMMKIRRNLNFDFNNNRINFGRGTMIRIKR